jgi:hypothetical protein
MIAERADVLKLLVTGGDDRLALDPVTGLNMYGYGAMPVPGDLAFSSSTASTISARSFAAVCERFDRLRTEIATGNASAIYACEIEYVRDRLRHAFGLAKPEADIIVAASGTDLHLIVAAMMRARHGRPVVTLSLTGSETGSGVGFAAGGRHAMPHPVSGRCVQKGEPIADDTGLASLAFAVRDADGELRPDECVAADLVDAIERAIGEGMHCILVATDVSKTGLIAPDLATVFALKAHFDGQLDILVDACQLRTAPETIRAYLNRGCLVAITGSKFVAGPIFSGALLVPAALAIDLKAAPLIAGLGDYSGSGDWPFDWTSAKLLPRRRNFGLLLRWQAALVELEAILDRHPLKLSWVAMRFADAVETRLKSDPRFAAIPSRRLDRSVLGLAGGPDVTPTIFPFVLKRGGRLLSAPEMTTVYQQLAAAGVRLGQPVAVGSRDGEPIAALRLCLSAPLISAAADTEGALGGLVADAMIALDRAAELSEARAADVA